MFRRIFTTSIVLAALSMAVHTQTLAAEAPAPGDPWAQATNSSTRVVTERKFVAMWEADGAYPPFVFDIRVSITGARAKHRNAWTQPAELQGIPGQRSANPAFPSNYHQPLHVKKGHVLCYSVRTTDSLGVTSAWSNEDCVSRAFDDHTLKSQGHVKRIHDQRFWSGTASSIYPGGRLTLPRVRKGSDVFMVYATIPGDDHLLFYRVPGRTPVAFSGYHQRRRFTIVDTYSDNTARRKGALKVFKSGGRKPALPLEGVGVVPRWMS